MDIITYIPDLNSFRAECKSKAEAGNKFFSINDGVISYNVDKIPVVYNEDYSQSVCLVRLVTDDEIGEFNSLTTCERIGICENDVYNFDDGGEDIYNSVYNQTPKQFMIDGKEYIHTPPKQIGVFA